MTPYDLAHMCLILGIAFIPYHRADNMPDEIAVITDNGDWVLFDRQQLQRLSAIKKRENFQPNYPPYMPGLPKYFKHSFQQQPQYEEAVSSSSWSRQRSNKFPQSGHSRQVCRSTTAVAKPLLVAPSINGTEVEVQPGQDFMISLCETGQSSCYGFSSERLSSSCETHFGLQNAIVRVLGSRDPWIRDHIWVPNGCTCRIKERVQTSTDHEWALDGDTQMKK